MRLKPARTPLVRSVFALLLIAAIPACRRGRRPLDPSQCIIAESETRALFAQLTPVLRGGDCSFDGLAGNHDRLVLTLMSGGHPVPPIVIAHPTCLPNAPAIGPRYVAAIPADTASRCPGAAQHIQTVLAAAPAR